MKQYNLGHTPPTLQHGGNIETAIAKYGFERNQWIDLSTGISPWSWPVQALARQVWNNLPPPLDSLLGAASQYYGIKHHDTSQGEANTEITRSIIATPGSQIAIRLLPQLFKTSTVAIPAIGYQEHAKSWKLANHQVRYYHSTSELFELLTTGQIEHCVIINPNNPSGQIMNTKTINDIARQVSGTMIIDEAFMDLYDKTSTPEKNNKKTNEAVIKSAAANLTNNMIVLRSIGKFFGLAGLRLGFVIGSHPAISQLNTLLQPWSISHASIIIGTQALSDQEWQQQQCTRIKEHSIEFLPHLSHFIDSEIQGMNLHYEIKSCGLFHSVLMSNFEEKNATEALTYIHQKLARKAIWTRLFNAPDELKWLRFALPSDIQEFKQRLVKHMP